MRALVFSVLLLLAVSADAAAQPYIGAAGPRVGSVEVSGAAVWTAGYEAGSQSAFETSNSSIGAPPLTLFTTDSEVPSNLGADGRVGVFVASRVSVEGSLHYSRPVLHTRLADDFENADPTTAEADHSLYVIGGSLLYHFGTGRVMPFVSGGAGYLREVSEGNADVMTGSEFHGGGGVKIWFGTGGHRLGVRVDALVSSRSKNAGFEDKRRILPLAAFGLSYLF